jgi:hypothetical protein
MKVPRYLLDGDFPIANVHSKGSIVCRMHRQAFGGHLIPVE